MFRPATLSSGESGTCTAVLCRPLYSPLIILYQNGLCFCKLSSKCVSQYSWCPQFPWWLWRLCALLNSQWTNYRIWLDMSTPVANAWSKYSAWCILSVSVMQMIFAVKEDCVNKTLFSVSFKINKLLYFEHMQPYSGAKQVFFASFSLTQLSFSHPAPRCLNGKYICSMGMLVWKQGVFKCIVATF